MFSIEVERQDSLKLAIICDIISKEGEVSYCALNSEITQEPDYEAALNALK